MLHNFVFLQNGNGKELFYKKSRRNIVFKAVRDSNSYAFRFFLNDDPELFGRYQQIQNYLESKPSSWKVPFEFLGEGYNPMLKMDWVDGLSFTQYLDLIITDSSRVSLLQKKLVALHHNLEGNGIGHGNLNMKHIRFVKQEEDYVIRLIDYDSMFIPSFKDKDSFSSGTAGFQHSMRLASDFSETIDRFSFWVFLTALEAFKLDPSLWQNSRQSGFNKEEQVLFTYRDLAFPGQSNAFQLLKRYHNSALKFYTEKLLRFCEVPSLENIEAPELYEEKDFHSGTKQNVYVSKEVHTTIAKETELKPTGVASVKPVLRKEKAIEPKPRSQRKEPEIIYAKPEVVKEKTAVQTNLKKKRPIAAIVIVLLLISSVAYFVWASQTKERSVQVTAVDQPAVRQQSVATTSQQKSVFTSTALSQFLFQLYQSYNKRELPSILSHYADTVNRYYDAGAITKDKLSDIIENLFIKPAVYECNPNIKSLQFKAFGDSCKLTVTINETIKPNAQSRTEHYSSKIAYIIDKSFKIQSENNIE